MYSNLTVQLQCKVCDVMKAIKVGHSSMVIIKRKDNFMLQDGKTLGRDRWSYHSIILPFFTLQTNCDKALLLKLQVKETINHEELGPHPTHPPSTT